MKKLFFIILLFMFSTHALATQLDEYVNKIDANFSWSLEKTVDHPEHRVFFIRLVSQSWRSNNEVNQPIWRHWLHIICPKNVTSEKALLVVSNGSDSEIAPEQTDSKWEKIALNTKSVVAELHSIPNQPLLFSKEREERSEDDLVAYSWAKALSSNDPTWSVKFPMVKSILRAMDTIQALMRNDKISIKNFVVTGASKRGWATWLSAAMDERITAIIPMAIDILAGTKFLDLHFSAYGSWAKELESYQKHGILARYKTPEFANLLREEDPLSYKDRLTLPKLIISASGDQIFAIDSARNYFSELQGVKYLRIIPNTDHFMINSGNWDCLEAFYSYLVLEQKLPEFSWKVFPDGKIEVVTSDRPEKVQIWAAQNPDARDFRYSTIGEVGFIASELFSSTKGKKGKYTYTPTLPSKGYLAYFIEIKFADHLIFTTEAVVLPEILPYQAPS